METVEKFRDEFVSLFVLVALALAHAFLAAFPAASEHAAGSVEPYVRALGRLHEDAAPGEESITSQDKLTSQEC